MYVSQKEVICYTAYTASSKLPFSILFFIAHLSSGLVPLFFPISFCYLYLLYPLHSESCGVFLHVTPVGIRHQYIVKLFQAVSLCVFLASYTSKCFCIQQRIHTPINYRILSLGKVKKKPNPFLVCITTLSYNNILSQTSTHANTYLHHSLTTPKQEVFLMLLS